MKFVNTTSNPFCIVASIFAKLLPLLQPRFHFCDITSNFATPLLFHICNVPSIFTFPPFLRFFNFLQRRFHFCNPASNFANFETLFEILQRCLHFCKVISIFATPLPIFKHHKIFETFEYLIKIKKK